MVKKVHAYAFTVLRPENTMDLFSKLSNRSDIDYFCYGMEKGSKVCIPHLQGYIWMKEPSSYSKVRRVIGKCYVERARKDPYTNYRYCKKEGACVALGDLDNCQMKWTFGSDLLTTESNSGMIKFDIEAIEKLLNSPPSET